MKMESTILFQKSLSKESKKTNHLICFQSALSTVEYCFGLVRSQIQLIIMLSQDISNFERLPNEGNLVLHSKDIDIV